MYALFTKEEKFNFVSNFGSVDFIEKTKGLTSYAAHIYHILLRELKRLFYKNEIKEDNIGIYVELSREIIGDRVKGGLCAHTVAKYIKELQRYGLLIDRRMGLKLCNRIYLKYRKDAKRYDIDKSENKKSENTKIENGQKNSGEAPASKTPHENPLINKANEIIAQIIDECLPYRTINQMLILCKDNLDDLNMAVQYCFGKTPTKSYTAMLMNTLREQYHKKKKERKKKREEKKSNSIPKVSKKVSDFNKMAEHEEWEFDKLEVVQRYHIQRDLGIITEEEYQQKITELGISL